MDLFVPEIPAGFSFLDNLIDLLGRGGRSLRPLLPPFEIALVLLVCLSGWVSSATDNSSSGGSEPMVDSLS